MTSSVRHHHALPARCVTPSFHPTHYSHTLRSFLPVPLPQSFPPRYRRSVDKSRLQTRFSLPLPPSLLSLIGAKKARGGPVVAVADRLRMKRIEVRSTGVKSTCAFRAMPKGQRAGVLNVFLIRSLTNERIQSLEAFKLRDLGQVLHLLVVNRPSAECY